MENPKTIQTLRELLDEVATMKTINEDLPVKYGFVALQYIQKLEEFLVKMLSLEHEQEQQTKNKKRNANRKR